VLAFVLDFRATFAQKAEQDGQGVKNLCNLATGDQPQVAYTNPRIEFRVLGEKSQKMGVFERKRSKQPVIGRHHAW
jgi:hypothetical protein